jgi:uncharacterized protein YutE (UPF0331/DUF86 family)
MVDRDLVASKLAELAGHHGVISEAVCGALGREVGLRNVIAHGYAGVRPELVHAAATAGLGDLEAFAREVAAWAQGGPEEPRR